MNKKIMAYSFMSLFALALVSGALVSYLSNKVTADVEVKLPIVQSISDTIDDWSEPDAWSDILVISDMYTGGLEPFTFYVKTKNEADVAVTGKGKNIITNPSGLSCSDFELVRAQTDSHIGVNSSYSGWYTLICSEINNYKVEFAYGPDPTIWDAGQLDITRVEVTFKQNAFGKYTFSSQVIPA